MSIRHAPCSPAPLRPETPMHLRGSLLAAFGAALLVAGCGGSSPSAPGPGTASSGERLYAASGFNCVQCHTNPQTMRRASDEATLAAMIGTAIVENRGRMGDPSLGLQSLDGQAQRDIAAYLLSLPAAAPSPAPSPAPAPAPTPGLPSGVTQQASLPAGYVACAREGSGSCTFTGSVTLAYGVANSGPYRLRSVSGPSFNCSTGNTTFGDPTPGAQKTCFGPSGQVNTIGGGGGGGGGGSVTLQTSTFASGLSSPWGMAFLPDGRLLVTQKGGSIVLLAADGASRNTLTWGSPRPDIRDGGQGGLLGIAIDPDYGSGSPWIYFSYQEPGANSTSGTAVGRAQISGTSLVNFQRLLQQTPKVGQDGVHFGSRLAFRADRTLLVSFGDRGQDDPNNPNANNAQSLTRSLGKVMRINRDGTIPTDNPVTPSGSVPGLFSWGHRNPQGLTVDSATGNIWETEHGPQGGDEVNLVQAGRNYGWPLRSYGCPYGAPVGDGCRVGGGTHAPLNGVTFTEPLTFWVPTSVAPSNVVVYRGSGFPEWTGNLLVGSLADPGLWRIVVNGTAFVSRERVVSNQGRIRDVVQGPDGWVYVATDGGSIVRIFR